MNTTDHHMSAAALILKAAEKSGLLKEVAEAIWFADKHRTELTRYRAHVCIPCEVLRALTEAFDVHTCLAGLTCESVLGIEGLAVFPPRGEEHEVISFLK